MGNGTAWLLLIENSISDIAVSGSVVRLADNRPLRSRKYRCLPKWSRGSPVARSRTCCWRGRCTSCSWAVGQRTPGDIRSQTLPGNRRSGQHCSRRRPCTWAAGSRRRRWRKGRRCSRRQCPAGLPEGRRGAAPFGSWSTCSWGYFGTSPDKHL